MLLPLQLNNLISEPPTGVTLEVPVGAFLISGELPDIPPMLVSPVGSMVFTGLTGSLGTLRFWTPRAPEDDTVWTARF